MLLIRQTIKQEKLPFWKVIVMICVPIGIMNIVFSKLSQYNPFIATVGGLATLISGGIACVLIIYKHVAYFNYKMIDDELIMEKVFGRASHMFLTLKLDELEKFIPYDELDLQKVKEQKMRVFRFISGKDIDQWYAGIFIRDKKKFLFVIKPNEELLGAITSFQKQS